MRIVLDTNVLIAAFIAHGSCNELLEHCALHHEIIVSKAICDEMQEVLVRKFGFARQEARAAVRLLRSRARMVRPVPLAKPVCRDPDDDLILAAAVAGRCDLLVSGDKDLTQLSGYQGVRILGPTEFWRVEKEILQAQGPSEPGAATDTRQTRKSQGC